MRFTAPLALASGLLAANATAQCPNDDSLGNTTIATAQSLLPGSSLFVDMVIPGAPAGQNPVNDLFSFDLAPGATGRFVVDRPTGVGAGLYAQIYDSNVALITGTLPVAGSFEIDYTNPGTTFETFYLRIHAGTASGVPTPCAEYSVAAYVDPCPNDDTLENFDSCDDSMPLPSSYAIQFEHLAVLDGDDDWFDITLLPGETFDADIAFLHADGDIDLVLRDATGGGCGATLASSTSVSNAEAVGYTNLGATPLELHVGVYLFSGTCNTYALHWSVTSAPDDAFEDNDSVCSPTIGLVNGVYDGLTVYDADSDFYMDSIQTNTRLVYAIEFDHAQGDLDMRLWDVSGGCGTAVQIGSSGSISDYEEVIVENTGTGVMDIVCEVFYYPSDGGSNTYTLTAAVGFANGIGEIVCDAVPNSINDSGLLYAIGSDVVADNDVALACQALPPNQFGFYSNSLGYGFVANPGGSTGNLCIANGTIGRYSGPGQILNTGTTGQASLAIDLTAMPFGLTTRAVVPGETWYFQFWHRDIVGGAQTSNFSRALRIHFR